MKGPDRLPSQVERWLEAHTIQPVATVVAVSGGPDSVALLRVLAELQTRGRVGPLVAAHLNHQLRGEASDGDEQFVHSLAAELAARGIVVVFRGEKKNIANIASANGANLEATARQVRYAWLGEVAESAGATWVMTGHTANDQAETILHRLLRGTGLQGLRGIAARRALGGGSTLLRPLLTSTRTAVLEYLEAVGQTARHDASNDDVQLTRNRIRHELLPLLTTAYNPAVVPVLCRLAEQADESYRDEEARATDLLAAAERPRAGNLRIFDLPTFATASRSCLRNALRLIWQQESWPVDAMNFQAWERLADVARGHSSTVDLPGKLHARSRGCVVQIGPRS